MNQQLGEPQRSKIEAMNERIHRSENLVSSDVAAIVDELYSIDLKKMPLLPHVVIDQPGTTPIAAIEKYMKGVSYKLTGAEARFMVNQLFGINLDALSSMEGCKISLFSKGQWMLRQRTDLFEVHTGEGDTDVAIFPTPYFSAQTGLNELPLELQAALLPLGYSKQMESGSFYYCSPNSNAVPDAFKGKTMQALMTIIKQLYSHL